MKRIISMILAWSMCTAMFVSNATVSPVTVDAVSEKTAIDIFVDNYSIWNELPLLSDGFSAVSFLDIDFDGELELVAGSQSGSDWSTAIEFYKIDGDKVIGLKTEEDLVYSFDIMDGDMSLYRDEDGELAYYGYDRTRSGMFYYGSDFGSFKYNPYSKYVEYTTYFANGYEMLYNSETKQNDEVQWYYGSSSESQISETEYEKLKKDTLSSLTDMQLTYKFVDIRNVAAEDELRDALSEAYEAFSYTGSNTDIVASGECGENLIWTLDSAGTLTISGQGAMKNWYYASDVPWRSYQDNISKVKIENGVTNIGEYAFYNCKSLTSITIPDSVTIIGNKAFCNCSSLASITIPKSVTSIGVWAFAWCKSLTSITFPEIVPSIGRDAFSYTPWLEAERKENPLVIVNGTLIDGKTCSDDVVIPDSVTSIGSNAFYGHYSLTSITIPDSVTSIGYAAFDNCSSLASITIPDSVTNIGGFAFSGCDKLTSITIPDSVTSIGGAAFYECSSLASITIPDSVTSIGDSAFSGCDKLTSITIPDSVTSIGDSAFYACSSLASITIPDSVTSIGDFAFDACSSLTSITIPKSVTSIGDFAFYACSSLTSITIPKSVTSIGWNSFYSCESLTSITFENPECTIYDSEDTISSTATIYGYEGSTAQAYAQKYDREFVALENVITTTTTTATTTITTKTTTAATTTSKPISTITATASATTATVNGLKYEIESDGSVTIYDYTGDASYLEIPQTIEGKPVRKIGQCAFEENLNIKNVVLPDTITEIAYKAFADCKELESINFPDSLKKIGDYAFTTCHSLKSIDLNQVEQIGQCTFQLCISLTAITVPGTITNIPDHAFHGCHSVEKLVFEEGVTSIESDAALNSYSLSEIVLPKSVTSIGEHGLGFTYYYPNYTRIDLTISGYTGTAAEVYANQYGFDFYAIDGSNTTTTTTAATTTATTATTTTTPTTTTTTSPDSGILLGDVSNDGTVSIDDAQLVLLEYVNLMAGLERTLSDRQTLAADVNGDHTISVNDAQYILSYYTEQLAGKTPSWDDII